MAARGILEQADPLHAFRHAGMINTLENSAAFQRTPSANPAASNAEHALNVCVMYEHLGTREWAGSVCARVAKLVGAESLRTTWWSLAELNEPAVLAGAVSTALHADVVVVAVRAAERFPLPFYVWADSWVPYRVKAAAALVALVALPERPTPQSERARDYLRAMARQGRLDFLIEERRLTDGEDTTDAASDSGLAAAATSPSRVAPQRYTLSRVPRRKRLLAA